MKKTADFQIGDRFGTLEALDGPYVGRDNAKSRYYYEVRCDCGTVKWLRKESLKVALSCGCLNIAVKVELAGQRFSRLVVVGEDTTKKRTYWNCLCDCGKSTSVRSDCLITGTTQSCGCLAVDNHAVKHGHGSVLKGRTRTYHIWDGMKQRATNLTHRDAPNYSARGIGIDPKWLQFEGFLEDMGECPKGKSIDRYPDNDGDYAKDNCRWATPKEQANNTRIVIKVPYLGGMATLSDLVEISGKKRETIRARLKRGMSAEEAVAA